MKKAVLRLIALMMILFLLPGCSIRRKQQPTKPTAPETTAPAPTDVLPETQPAVDPLALYAQPIARYRTALTEQWDEGKYYENEMSASAAYYYEGNPLENVGIAFLDMDGDGSDELIIGAILNARQDPAVFEIWTLEGETPVLLVQSAPRNRYFLASFPEEPGMRIVNHGSGGAALFSFLVYALEDGSLKPVQGVLFNAMESEANPWFLIRDDDWDISNDTPTDEQTANALMDTYRSAYTVADYTPYSALPDGA